MKERPKFGDRVEFKSHGLTLEGKVIAVAPTGVHFLIETPFTPKVSRKIWKYRRRLIKVRLSGILRILPRAVS